MAAGRPTNIRNPCQGVHEQSSPKRGDQIGTGRNVSAPRHTYDVAIIGAGHNALVCAAMLARTGLSVGVYEAAEVIGGACRTEYPFSAAPHLGASTGAYLLGPFPPELLHLLDIQPGRDIHPIRRDPHYFMPTLDHRYLLLGSDRADSRRQFAQFFTEQDARATEHLAAEISAIVADVAPAWLQPVLPVEDTAERYLRPQLRQSFIDLVQGSAIDYLTKFDFASENVMAMYAVTDGMPGLSGSPWDPGSGHNFLVHNMCRLPSADGTWMVSRGGMGAISTAIATKARKYGAHIVTEAPVATIDITDGSASGITLSTGQQIKARTVIVGCDVFRLPELLGQHCPAALNEHIVRWSARSAGQTMKINLALRGLPTFNALPDPRGQHGTTVHLMPEAAAGGSLLQALHKACADAAAGSLDSVPPLEWYLHSTLDPTLQDAQGNHSSALFVQGVPFKPAGSNWDVERAGYVERVLDLAERYAPNLRQQVVEVQALAPSDIQDYFKITHGNIHHVDPTFSFTERMPYDTGVSGVIAASAGCFPSGSVIGAAGHNAARQVFADLALAVDW